MTVDLQKNVIFLLFPCLQILQANEWILKFSMTMYLQKDAVFRHFKILQIL